MVVVVFAFVAVVRRKSSSSVAELPMGGLQRTSVHNHKATAVATRPRLVVVRAGKGPLRAPLEGRSKGMLSVGALRIASDGFGVEHGPPDLHLARVRKLWKPTFCNQPCVRKGFAGR